MANMERQRRSDEPTAAAVRSEPFPNGTSIARYNIVSFIGSGAMGDVYRAHDRALGRDVALKVLPPDLTGDRERVRRFAHEARAASALSHPHIVGIHEVGHAKPVVGVQPIGERPQRRPDVHYIAMEYIQGETLREAMNGLSVRRGIELMAQVADGLGKAHAAGIIHRDLKPENILVSSDGYAKIVDFGLAKLTDTSWNPIGADSPTLRALTAHGELLGTPGYMSPEQIVGKPLDARADIFSFGCILYEVVSHARPFEAESFVDTLYKILHEEPVPLAQHVPNTPPELQRIVDRCLAKDREHRYQSVRDLAADLRLWHGDSGPRSAPVLAAGPLRPRITARFALLAALIAAVPILAWIFLGGTPERIGGAPEANVRRITTDGRATQAVISPDGRYVAYITADAKGRTLWLEQIATGRTIQLTTPANIWYTGIAFSRDGEYVYYSRYDSGPLGNLYRVPILGGAAEKLSKDVDSRVTLSPDDKQYAFVRDDFNKGTSTIVVADANGKNERNLAQFKMPDRVFFPAWSPDGESIVAVQQPRIVRVDAKTGKAQTLKVDLDVEAFRGLGWRDANHIVTAASSEDTGGHFRLWNVDVRSGEAVALSSELTEILGPTISDDGSVAALQVIRQSNLFEVSNKGGVQQLTSGIGSQTGLTGVAWLGDAVIYTSAGDGKMDLFSRRGSETTRLTDDTAHELWPAVAPNGSFIAYLSSSGGGSHTHTVWRVAPDGTDRRKLTNGPRDGAFAISPDSKSIAYASFDKKSDAWMLFVMTADGGAPRHIASRKSVLEQIRFTRDGKTLIFTGYERDMLRLFRVPVAGGKMEMVIPEGRAKLAAISPDGRTIAAPYGSAEKMYGPVVLLPVTGGPMKQLELDGGMYEWHPDGKALSFVREQGGAMNLWTQELDGETAKKLTWFSEGSIYHYAWSGDGSRAVLTHVVDAMDVVLIR